MKSSTFNSMPRYDSLLISCRYLIASKSSTYNQSLSMFICELALTSIELMMFPSSVLAATAVFITRLTIHRLHQRDLLTDEELLMLWNPELQSASGLKIADMFRCVTTYKDYYAGLQRYVNLAAAFKVVEKYTKDFYGVAKIRLSFE